MNKKVNDIFKQCKRMPVDEAFVDLLRVRLSETMEADVRMGLAQELVAKRAPSMLSARRLVPAFIVLALIFTSGGTVFASQVSLPGETLYPVKLLSEDVRVAVAFTPAKKAELQVEYAAERTKEIDVVIALRATSTLTVAETRDIDHALTNYTRNLEGAGRHADELRARGDDNEARKININISEAALTYRDALERTASSTEIERVREHLREAASSTEALQKKAERDSHDDEQEQELKKHEDEKKSEERTTNTQTEIKPVETKEKTDWESASIEKTVKSSGEKREVEDRH